MPRYDNQDSGLTDAKKGEAVIKKKPQTQGQPALDRFVTLKSEECTLIIETVFGQRPRIIYWGAVLEHSAPEELALLSMRQWAFGGPAIDVLPSLSNELGTGMCGPSGFIAHRDGKDWASIFKLEDVEWWPQNQVSIICADENNSLRIQYDIALDPISHVLSAKSVVTNLGKHEVSIDWCSALCIPLNHKLTRLMAFSGRWAMEFQTQKIDAFPGSYVRENKSGRTSHDNFPGLIALGDGTNETKGVAAGFHFGWSGNNRVRADQNADNQTFVQMGELFAPGEMKIPQGCTYETPVLYAAWSEQGLNRLSQHFHTHLTSRVMDCRIKRKPRPVHYNTWEAVYFDHSEAKLLALAKKAAWIGAERFVLDDGWFGARRSDSAGLGDWWVAKEVYPNGLAPLTKLVGELGMEFGLWFEPEMVNPDSDLFRSHPDWILEVGGVEQIPSRNQYALDLTKDEVFDYLFEKLSAVIDEYNVAYIKWDMNRDIHHPGSSGRSVIHRQTKSVYALMNKLRTYFPDLEIESCSSGGGRSDYGVLGFADRIWPSDSNDPLDRQKIQRGASYFFPLAVSGAHVGPRECHITRRTFTMEFRAATAFFGHMGMELDLLGEAPEDLDILKGMIALHKKHRQLLHSGDLVRIDGPDYLNSMGVIAKDKSQGLFSCTKMDSHKTTLPGRFQFIGLDPGKRYRLKIIWPTKNISVTSPSIIETANLMSDGTVFSGEALIKHGIQFPLLYPESCIIYHLASD